MADDAMYQAFVELVPTSKGFDRAVGAQMGPAGAKAQGSFTSGFGKNIGLKFAGIVGAAFTAVQVGDLIGNAITDAADRGNAWGAVEQVFGDRGAAAVEAFSKSAAEKIGQSSTAVFDAAKSIGVFGKAAGLSNNDLAAFSTDLIALGADFAAFGNTSPEEAVEAISAALRGESEPIRKYGILLDDAALKARALAMGIYSGKGPLTQQQRILAANAEILEQSASADITGQFEREADSLIGMQTTLNARMEELSADAGEALLPLAEKLVEWVSTEGTDRLQGFVDWLTEPETAEGIAQFADNTVAVVDSLAKLVDWLSDIFGGIAEIANWLDTDLNQGIQDFFGGVNDKSLEFYGGGVAGAVARRSAENTGLGTRGPRTGGGTLVEMTINPQKGQSEEEIGKVAVSRIESILRGTN